MTLSPREPPPIEAPDGGLHETRLLAAADAMGLTLPRAAPKQLQTYFAAMTRWNSVHNLTSIDGASGSLVRHVFDSLALVTPLARHAEGRQLKVLDVGTGAGLPAVVLAIARPDWAVTAIDAVGKKVAFIRQAAAEAGVVNIHPRHTRVENYHHGLFDVIVSRAFASLKAFVDKTGHLRASDGVWVAQKGKRPDDEMAALPPQVEMFHVEPVKVPDLHAERCLVWMRGRVG